MDNASRVRFVSLTFLAGFGIGAFAGVALALIALALAQPADEPEPQVFEIPIPATPSSGVDEPPAAEVRAGSTLEVRVGPGESFATVGTVSRGARLQAVGRDSESEWLVIAYPFGSSSRGWVPLSMVQGLTASSVEELAVLQPTPIPTRVSTPGSSSSQATPADTATAEEPAAEGSVTPEPTGSDLAIFTLQAEPDGRISIVVLNAGPSAIQDGEIILEIRGAKNRREVLRFSGSLPSGSAVAFLTDQVRVGSRSVQIQVVLDPSSLVDDPNRANNVHAEVLSLPEPEAQGSPSAIAGGGSKPPAALGGKREVGGYNGLKPKPHVPLVLWPP